MERLIFAAGEWRIRSVLGRAGLGAASRGRFANRPYQTTVESSIEASGFRARGRKLANQFLDRAASANHLFTINAPMHNVQEKFAQARLPMLPAV
jgi:hypothetical protein